MTSSPLDNQVSEFVTELVSFIVGLAKEGERSLVIGGAARIDVALERLLKSITRHSPGGNDNLFDADRPLGTFSAKISLAYRLDLLTDGMEHSLQMIRKLRNDFAHATTDVSLSESSHRNRLNEIKKCAQESSLYQVAFEAAARTVPELPDSTVSLVIALGLIASAIEIAVWENGPLKNLRVADLRDLKPPQKPLSSGQ